MARIQGDYGAIDINTTGTTYEALACFRSFTINEPRSYSDATCMGDANLVYAEGKRDFSGQGEAMLDTDDLDTLTTIRSGGEKALRVYPDKTNESTTFYSGDMFISGGLTVAVGQPVSMQCELRAAGNISFTTS
jgi:hypothetical protein